MVLFWVGLGVMGSMPLAIAAWLLVLHFRLRIKYLHILVRIFQEKPLFIIPRGEPLPDAERVSLPTPDGLTLTGCYLTHPAGVRRRGVILFGLEFGSDCWSCRGYCDYLLEAGFDVFAFESRNQGSSDRLPGYEPLQWVTDYEVRDTQAALAYLKARPDADPRGVGFFGISKGAGAGLIAAGLGDELGAYVRCCVTDGAFATYSTLVPYMRHWFRIYSSRHGIQALLPSWYYGVIGRIGLRQIERERQCHFPDLEKYVGRLAPRPLLMIHGEADTYIKPEMACAVFERARDPKEFWLVEGAKHNQALQADPGEYRARVLSFFEQHLASEVRGQKSEVGGRAALTSDL